MGSNPPDGSYAVDGALPRGALDPLRGKLDRLEHAVIVTRDVPAADAQVAAVSALLDAGLGLWRADIEVSAARIEVAGTALTEGQAEEVRALVRRSGEALGRRVATEVVVDKETLGSEEGFVKPLARRSPDTLALIDERGTERHPDEVGRIAAGLYRLADTDRWIAVAEGRTSWLPADPETAPSIVVAGRRFVLDDDVRTIGPGDEGALVFTATPDDTDGIPDFGWRFSSPGVRADASYIASHRDFLHQVVLHADMLADSRAAFETLQDNNLSDHFAIDWDSTLFQRLDPAECAYHAGEANQRSIAVTLNNLMPNLELKPSAPAWPKVHPRRAEMGSPGFERSESAVMTINEARVRSWGYTAPQYRALGSLLRTLAAIFPRIAKGAPRLSDGSVVARVVDEPEHADGVMAHWHWAPERWDPGPGFDWERLGLDRAPGP